MEQIVKLSGRIAEVMPVVSGISDRTGNAWKSQEYLFEYFAWSGAKYANRMVVRAFGEDDITKFNLKQGEEVTLTIRFDANKSKDGSRWFNEIRISNVERPQGTQQPAQAQNAAAVPTNAPQPNNNPPVFERPATGNGNGDNDDLPF
jgi:hypothetical protein